MRKNKKTPKRKCIVTQEMKPKQAMIRIVRNKEGDVFIDPTGKQNGRGAYMTIDETIVRKAEADRVLEKTFQVKIDPTIYEQLLDLAKDQEHEK